MDELQKLSRLHVLYVKNTYTAEQYDAFVVAASCEAQPMLHNSETATAYQLDEIGDIIVMWAKKANRSFRRFDDLVDAGDFHGAYAMLITAAILNDKDPMHFQRIYHYPLPTYAMRGYTYGGVDCAALVDAIREVLSKNVVKIGVSDVDVSGKSLQINEDFCVRAIEAACAMGEAAPFLEAVARAKIPLGSALIESHLECWQQNSKPFADAIAHKNIKQMDDIIKKCGPMIAMFPSINKSGHKVSPIYHCFMSILSAHQPEASFRRTFLLAGESLLDLTAPTIDPAHLSNWGRVLSLLDAKIRLAASQYKKLSEDVRQTKYGLFAPYETAVWCGSGNYYNNLAALVHAGGDCTLQRSPVAAIYLREWERVQRRQRRIAWMARVLFPEKSEILLPDWGGTFSVACHDDGPKSLQLYGYCDGGGILMHALVHGQFQLAYELGATHRVQMPTDYDPFAVLAKMINDPRHRDTANGAITTLSKIKPMCCIMCSEASAELMIDYPATLQVLLRDFAVPVNAGCKLHGMVSSKYQRLKDDNTAMTMENEYIKRVELNALGAILQDHFNDPSWHYQETRDVITFSHAAMANPLLPPLACDFC
jgi:hypothetical protein